MAKHKRYIHKYDDNRFTLQAWIEPEPWSGFALKFTDKNDPNNSFGGSWSKTEKDLIDFTQCLIALVKQITLTTNGKEQ